MDCGPPGSSVHGISQARILEWVAISFSRGSSQPGIGMHSSASPALAGGCSATVPPGSHCLNSRRRTWHALANGCWQLTGCSHRWWHWDASSFSVSLFGPLPLCHCWLKLQGRQLGLTSISNLAPALLQDTTHESPHWCLCDPFHPPWLHPGPQGTEQAGSASLLSPKALICQRSVKELYESFGLIYLLQEEHSSYFIWNKQVKKM